ncbi:MAG: hypothetical protein D9V47_10735 [Clostridia bacterium]|nr:MAG: hypothetical protein D9V47_10735 [Clostridia bacterium]
MAIQTRFTPELITEYTEKGWWPNITLGQYFRRNVARFPDKLAVADGERGLTYKEFGELVDRLATGLVNAGIRRYDRVAVQLPNSIEFLAAFQAIALVGGVIVPVVPIYRHWEVTYILNKSRAKGIIVLENMGGFNYVEMLKEIRSEVSHLEHAWVIGLSQPQEGFTPYEDLIKDPINAEIEAVIQENQPDPNDPVVMNFTSGTEANPKAPMYTHNTMSCLGWYWPLVSDDRVLALLPLCHSFGGGMGPFEVLNQHGGTLIVSPRAFNPAELVSLGEKYKATVYIGVPAHYNAVLNLPDIDKRDFSSVRFLFSAGSSLPAETVRRFKELTGCNFINVFGMSETCCGPSTSLDDPLEVPANTIGRSPHPALEVKIFRDDRKTECEIGEPGELAQRGPHIFAGYFEDPELTARAFNQEGWFFTGDMAMRREDGNLVIVGRKKDIIVRGGRNISPEELENVVYENPKVFEVAAVAMPDPQLGEKVCLYVVPKPGETITYEEILEQFRVKKMANYKMPERIEIIEALPRTPTGKIRKNVLRDMIRDKLQKEVAEQVG